MSEALCLSYVDIKKLNNTSLLTTDNQSFPIFIINKRKESLFFFFLLARVLCQKLMYHLLLTICQTNDAFLHSRGFRNYNSLDSQHLSQIPEYSPPMKRKTRELFSTHTSSHLNYYYKWITGNTSAGSDEGSAPPDIMAQS